MNIKEEKFNLIKKRCGIAGGITAYDEDLKGYIQDSIDDMLSSGVPELVLENEEVRGHEGAITAIVLYVKAYLGNDRTDTEKYLDLYRKKVSRLALEEPADGG